MIEELRKFCGYFRILIDDNFCSHPLNFDINIDDIDLLLNQPTLKCSEEACPFIVWINCVTPDELSRSYRLKTQKAKDYLLI